MRSCLFCDQSVSSKEHAWPLWLLRALRPFGKARATIHAERRGQNPTSWQVVDDGITVRFVCGTCNNGWMSETENAAKPIIERLLKDGTETIDRVQQEQLAVWAIKSAMVFEALRSEKPMFYLSSERHTLRESRLLPRRTTIWIAKCVNQPNAYSSALDLSGTVEETAQRVEAYVTTMAFGSLAIQVLSGRMPDGVPTTATITAELRPGPWDDVVLRIWPIAAGAIEWPRQMGLDGDIGIEAFSERWSP